LKVSAAQLEIDQRQVRSNRRRIGGDGLPDGLADLVGRRAGNGLHLGQREQNRYARRVLREHSLVTLARRGYVAALQVDDRQVARRREEIGLQLERLLEVAARLFQVALGKVDGAAKIGDECRLRLLLLQRVDDGQRLVVFAPAHVRGIQREVGLVVGRILRRKRFELTESPLGVAGSEPNLREPDFARHVALVEVVRAFVRFLRELEITGRQIGFARRAEKCRIVGMAL
jgi:hypothetical protein